MAATYKMANEHGIKWIISGGNIATEGIMPKAWGYDALDLKHIKAIFYMFSLPGLKSLGDLPTISLFRYIWNRFVKGIKIVGLLDYYEYNREQAISILRSRYGWENYGEKHDESKFTKWFQDYYLPKVHGIDKQRAHYSSMICSKQMSRDTAVQLMKQRAHTPPEMTVKCALSVASNHSDFPSNVKVRTLLSKLYRSWK